MAEVIKQEQKVEVVQKELYMLKLDKHEAQFLVDVLASVGGSQTESRRKYATAISKAFEYNGMVRQYPPARDKNGDIVFDDLY